MYGSSENRKLEKAARISRELKQQEIKVRSMNLETGKIEMLTTTLGKVKASPSLNPDDDRRPPPPECHLTHW